jgi:hypothetical protein
MTGFVLRRSAVVLWSLLLSGCGTHYWYMGRMEAKDSAGKTRDILVYWGRTERALWHDGVDGGVRVKAQCGGTIVYEEKEDGILFRARGSDLTAAGQPVPLGSVCGRVFNAAKVADLKEDELQVDVQCRPKVTDFSTSLTHYLQAGRYTFQIVRETGPVEKPPDTKPCDAP